MKRTYDPRKVKRHRSYTVQDLAELYGVGPNTVRQWIKKHGLPVIEGTYPILMHCEAIRSWMIEWQAARKWTNGPDKMSCFSCGGPRRIKLGTFRIAESNKANLMLHGDCETCGKPLNRATSRAKLEADRANFTQKSQPHSAPPNAHNSNFKSLPNPLL